jgi:hypothetical protein
MIWTPEADAMLRELWEAGGSLTTIANAMHEAGYVVSRSAISGRKSRLVTGAPFSKRRPAISTPAQHRSKMKFGPTTTAPTVVKTKPKPGDPEPQEGVNYLENEWGCRSLLDKIGTDGLRMCCGKTRGPDYTGSQSSYCPDHFRLYHNNPPGMRRTSYG